MAGKRRVDLTGKRSGRLTVLYEAEPTFDNRGFQRRRWMCQCDCGNLVVVRSDSLNGRTKSCGCLQREAVSEYGKSEAHREASTSHGDSRERIRNIWYLIKYRCVNERAPAYGNYGGRGIKLCDEWMDDIDGYQAFKEWAYANGYADDLSIDRIDNDGDYCPENCRWVDAFVQGNNKRDNHLLTHNGETHTIAEWSRITGIDRRNLYHRAYLGWDEERIFSQPYRKSSKRI